MRKLLLLPYTFVMLNWAPVVGLYYFLRKGAGKDIWLNYKLKASATGQRPRFDQT